MEEKPRARSSFNSLTTFQLQRIEQYLPIEDWFLMIGCNLIYRVMFRTTVICSVLKKKTLLVNTEFGPFFRIIVINRKYSGPFFKKTIPLHTLEYDHIKLMFIDLHSSKNLLPLQEYVQKIGRILKECCLSDLRDCRTPYEKKYSWLRSFNVERMSIRWSHKVLVALKTTSGLLTVGLFQCLGPMESRFNSHITIHTFPSLIVNLNSFAYMGKWYDANEASIFVRFNKEEGLMFLFG